MPKNLPFMTTLEPGTYYWCTCGKSAKAPFCDGAHKGSGKEPLAFEVAETRKAALCACRRTKKAPYCDGAHARVD
ncbi:MAG TPA: CDGSH iron-sulfur domain-containing protein [Nitrospirota bacterium]|nr:CDGSH iron-sulfur domain-containing protein [Nitrospirota bacterium]